MLVDLKKDHTPQLTKKEIHYLDYMPKTTNTNLKRSFLGINLVCFFVTDIFTQVAICHLTTESLLVFEQNKTPFISTIVGGALISKFDGVHLQRHSQWQT